MLRRLLIVGIFILIGSWVYRSDKTFEFYGSTMGTTYTVRVSMPLWVSREKVEWAIEARLSEINKSMSTYDDSSEISRFNGLLEGEPLVVSEDFYSVLLASMMLYDITDGAWDGAVGSGVAFDQLEIRDGFEIVKKDSRLRIDLSSIAKGYGVDALGVVLQSFGARRAYIEIGGEVLVFGAKPDGELWRIGVETPVQDDRELYGVLEIEGGAVASSGDYRQPGHIKDPKTGKTVDGSLAVTVVAPTCVIADGLATALMVMGLERGQTLVNSLDEIEALFIIQEGSELRSVVTDFGLVREL